MTDVSYGVEANYSKGIVIREDCDGRLIWFSQCHAIRGALESKENTKMR